MSTCYLKFQCHNHAIIFSDVLLFQEMNSKMTCPLSAVSLDNDEPIAHSSTMDESDPLTLAVWLQNIQLLK